MRKSTFLWLALAAFCGASLYHTSQQVHARRDHLAEILKDVGKEEESIRVLSAEWSYLNQPRRLEKLAGKYLPLTPLKGSQFIAAEDLPLRGAAPPAETAVSSLVAPVLPRQKKPPVPQKEPKTAERSFFDVIRGLGVN